MDLRYENKKIKEYCSSIKKAKSVYGNNVAEKLYSIINILESAENLFDIKAFSSYRLHPLGIKDGIDRTGQLSITLAKSKYRLIIIPLDEKGKKWDGNDMITIYKISKVIILMEVVDYHD